MAAQTVRSAATRSGRLAQAKFHISKALAMAAEARAPAAVLDHLLDALRGLSAQR